MSNAPKLLKARQHHSRIFAVIAILLLLVIQPKMPSHAFPRECMLWVGYVLIIIGAMGRSYCSAYIGGRKNDVIMRDGPFSVVRNPLYVFSFLAMTGVALQSGMWTVVILLVAAFLLYYPQVVAKEEAFLLHKFGQEYAQYRYDVPRWVPKMKLWHEPETVEAHPKFIRRTLMDASVFFLPMPAFAIIEELHQHGVLPVWWTLM